MGPRRIFVIGHQLGARRFHVPWKFSAAKERGRTIFVPVRPLPTRLSYASSLTLSTKKTQKAMIILLRLVTECKPPASGGVMR